MDNAKRMQGGCKDNAKRMNREYKGIKKKTTNKKERDHKKQCAPLYALWALNFLRDGLHFFLKSCAVVSLPNWNSSQGLFPQQVQEKDQIVCFVTNQTFSLDQLNQIKSNPMATSPSTLDARVGGGRILQVKRETGVYLFIYNRKLFGMKIKFEWVK